MSITDEIFDKMYAEVTELRMRCVRLIDQRDEALELVEKYRKVAVAAARWRGTVTEQSWLSESQDALCCVVDDARASGLLTDEELAEGES